MLNYPGQMTHPTFLFGNSPKESPQLYLQPIEVFSDPQGNKKQNKTFPNSDAQVPK